ncbi:MAG: hypothetical protein HC919_06450 [Oscillatoriales cyanobacterium SM2_2_1]|nr:hypothetical protein [Oscillatoriales cyanobacterium SM2_2_1]
MIYTYAFLLSPPPKAGIAGIGQRVEFVTVGTIAAAVEQGVDVQRLKAESEDLLLQAVLDHERVVQSLFRLQAVLPLRFGTAFLSVEHLMDYLKTMQLVLGERLQQLEGYSEFLLEAVRSDPPASAEESDSIGGLAYLEAKKERYRVAQRLQESILREAEQVWQLVNSYPSYRVPTNDPKHTRVYLLLHGEERTHVQAVMEHWQGGHSQWQISWSQPLPPYHFVSATETSSP